VSTTFVVNAPPPHPSSKVPSATHEPKANFPITHKVRSRSALRRWSGQKGGRGARGVGFRSLGSRSAFPREERRPGRERHAPARSGPVTVNEAGCLPFERTRDPGPRLRPERLETVHLIAVSQLCQDSTGRFSRGSSKVAPPPLAGPHGVLAASDGGQSPEWASLPLKSALPAGLKPTYSEASPPTYGRTSAGRDEAERS
jgi:hypothetical protein